MNEDELMDGVRALVRVVFLAMLFPFVLVLVMPLVSYVWSFLHYAFPG